MLVVCFSNFSCHKGAHSGRGGKSPLLPVPGKQNPMGIGWKVFLKTFTVMLEGRVVFFYTCLYFGTKAIPDGFALRKFIDLCFEFLFNYINKRTIRYKSE